MVALKNRIRAVQERDGYCTFLIERPSSLHHVSNPSCVAMKSATATTDVVMGEDAVEIGAREAFKHTFAKGKHRNLSVYGPSKRDSNSDELQLITAEASDTDGANEIKFPLFYSDTYTSCYKLKFILQKNPKEKAIPSDVKHGTHLSKTHESSLRKLVTKFISMAFPR
ncbi:hypothetical protein DICVIV_01834 [Dictyocaulus viviparus]|uniref:Uncharacterized protein n=1 Tax=Dictyocaulus viviparus TaxID=29172 RepID=A0A0D8Y501_DICVI|nr:hypothetical protein DICVIV_01834 [Dictyocaulus viviparus]